MENVPTVYIQSQKILDELLEARKNESQKILDECSSIATKKRIVITTTLLEGNPASTILEFSQSEKYEVIIIGSRGMGQFKELVLGSVSSKVVPSFVSVQYCLSDEFNRIQCLLKKYT